ncbi:MAG: glycosyltransferase, partial [Planctomycetes bacterium]|nr:glycosyltransferase [Planctomycetota bacterium]
MSDARMDHSHEMTRTCDAIAPGAATVHADRQTRCQSPTLGPPGLRRLSVIIPTFNEERTIAHTLDRMRGGSAWEVIVVDGRSTDRTREIARSHGATVV